MADQIVITEKTSQAKDVRAAVGGRYGTILPDECHLFDLVEPEEVSPDWKRWTAVLLRPDGLYGTKPATGGNEAPKLKAIRGALRKAKRVWLAIQRVAVSFQPAGRCSRSAPDGIYVAGMSCDCPQARSCGCRVCMSFSGSMRTARAMQYAERGAAVLACRARLSQKPPTHHPLCRMMAADTRKSGG